MKQGPGLALTLPIAGFLLALPQMALAGDEIRASGDVTTTGGYSSNPFSDGGSDLGSSYVQVNAQPEIRLIAEHSVISLTGLLNYQHFFRDYPDSIDYQGTLDYHGNPSSRLTTHAKARYDSSIIGGFDAINPVTNPEQPQPPSTTGTDLSLFGTRERRRSLDLSGDAAYLLSARDSLTVNAFFDAVRYGGVLSYTNYNGYGGGAGYSRTMSDHLQLGVQASIARYVYQGLLGTAQVYSLQATINDQFSPRWNLTASVGGSYSDRTIGGKKITPSGNLKLCRVSTRVTLCATASEAVLPTGVTGTVVEKSAGASYSYRFSEHSKLSLSGGYSHNDEPAGALPVDAIVLGTSFVTVTATYDRTLRERIHFIATSHYRKIMDGGLGNRPADFGGSLGILVRLGEYK